MLILPRGFEFLASRLAEQMDGWEKGCSTHCKRMLELLHLTHKDETFSHIAKLSWREVNLNNELSSMYL
jgi:hypothetical protein